MKDRIKLIMESQHMTQQTFSQFLGISSAALSSIFNGRTRPTINTVEAIHQKIPNINVIWLMFGTGDMYVNEGDNSTSKPQDQAPKQQELEFDSTTQETLSSPKVKGLYNKAQTRVLKSAEVNFSDRFRREITEIRVYFDDQTYETFVPGKNK